MDVSAIEGYIRNLKDASVKDQIRKKLKKVRENPLTGESKRFKLKGIYATKVNRQRIVILYRIVEEDCMIVFIDIGTHEDVYGKTY